MALCVPFPIDSLRTAGQSLVTLALPSLLKHPQSWPMKDSQVCYGLHLCWQGLKRAGKFQIPETEENDDDGDEGEEAVVPLASLDSEGRAIILDFGPFLLVNAYFPNDDRSIKGFKMAFHLAMENFCKVR